MNSFEQLDFNNPLTITPHISINSVDEPLDMNIVIYENVELFTLKLLVSPINEIFETMQGVGCDDDGNELMSAYIQINQTTRAKIIRFFSEIGIDINDWVKKGATTIWFDWYERN